MGAIVDTKGIPVKVKALQDDYKDVKEQTNKQLKISCE
jgi:hypothetical protein